mmetsp:Transcript_2204/g.3617  ORF Transcript_2204/g.3617 Transcript_2204/m.3617 type:complete len:89 (-) Transcript_2204:190-456(-)
MGRASYVLHGGLAAGSGFKLKRVLSLIGYARVLLFDLLQDSLDPTFVILYRFMSILVSITTFMLLQLAFQNDGTEKFLFVFKFLFEGI